MGQHTICKTVEIQRPALLWKLLLLLFEVMMPFTEKTIEE